MYNLESSVQQWFHFFFYKVSVITFIINSPFMFMSSNHEIPILSSACLPKSVTKSQLSTWSTCLGSWVQPWVSFRPPRSAKSPEQEERPSHQEAQNRSSGEYHSFEYISDNYEFFSTLWYFPFNASLHISSFGHYIRAVKDWVRR